MHLSVDSPQAQDAEVFLYDTESGYFSGPIGYVIEVCDGDDGCTPFFRQHEMTPEGSRVFHEEGMIPTVRMRGHRNRVHREAHSPVEVWLS